MTLEQYLKEIDITEITIDPTDIDIRKLFYNFAYYNCKEAVEKTRSKCIDLVEEWIDAGNPNVKRAVQEIEQIREQDVLPEL